MILIGPGLVLVLLVDAPHFRKIAWLPLKPPPSDADMELSSQTGNSSPIAERGTEGKESSSFLLDIGTQESGENTRKI